MAYMRIPVDNIDSVSEEAPERTDDGDSSSELNNLSREDLVTHARKLTL